MSVLFALSLCLPGGIYSALATEGGDTAADEAVASAPQDSTPEQSDPSYTDAQVADVVEGDGAVTAIDPDAAEAPATLSDEATVEQAIAPAADTLTDASDPAATSGTTASEQEAQDAAESTDGEVAPASISAAADSAADSARRSIPNPLQQMVDDAPDGATVTITSDMQLFSTVTIPAGKTVTLTDDGQSHSLSSVAEPMFAVEGTLIISATSDDALYIQGIKTGAEKQGTAVTVNGGKLDLRAGTITGSVPYADMEGTIDVFGGTFDMSGGIITGQRYEKHPDLYGAHPKCIYIGKDEEGNSSTFNMTGGAITNNDQVYGVTVDNSTMNMSGGSIEQNGSGGIFAGLSSISVSGGSISNNGNDGLATGITALYSDLTISEGLISGNNGEGIELLGNLTQSANFTMTGGTISGNNGVDAGGIYALFANSIEITGGTIANNHSYRSGGGICVANCNSFTVTACNITGNSAAEMGGGIYLNFGVTNVHLDSALVEGNEATFQGGGVWCCPTSIVGLNVTEGMAVFGNAAVGDDAAGDDFVTMGAVDHYIPNPDVSMYPPTPTKLGEFDKLGRPFKGAQVNVSKRMLGGGLNAFYVDGAVGNARLTSSGDYFFTLPNEWFYVDPSVPRYNANNPGPTVDIDGTLISRALKSLPSEEAKQAAHNEAKIFITDNTAYLGGGVACNGLVSSGSTEEWELSVTKTWDSSVDQADYTPVPVFVVVDGDVLDYVILDANNNWTASFNGLPDPDSVQSISVIEGSFDENGNAVPIEPSDKWTVTYSGIDRDIDTNQMSVTVTNSSVHETVDVNVEKVWVGQVGGPVTVHLLADGADNGQTITLDEVSGWKGSFTGLPKLAADGHEIVYTVSEDVPSGYTSSVEGDMSAGFTITNTESNKPHPETVSVPVSKVWVGETAGPVTVHLLADGKDSGKTITLDEPSGWNGSFTDLPKLAADDHEIVYTVSEDVPEGYTSEITGDAKAGLTITNTKNTEPALEIVNISVSKVWVGEESDSVIVHLLADGEDSGHIISLNKASGWRGSFTDLPKLAEDGHEIVYTVSEDVPSGYTSKTRGDAKTGFTIINTQTTKQIPETVTVPVSKVWVGEPAESVTVYLFANGIDTDRSITLDKAGNWKGAFTDLPKLDPDGHEIAYSVSEDVPDGYTSKITGDAKEGFTVTNTRNPGSDKPIPRTADNTSSPLGPVGIATFSLVAGIALLMYRGAKSRER